MSSLAALLHDDVPQTIVVSGSRPAPNGKKAWFNQQTSGCGSADNAALRIAGTGRNAYIKHAVHDGTLNEHRRPLCTTTHFPASRSFFLDVDVGHGNGYDTLSSASTALKAAMRELYRIGLPRPNLLQTTGGGLQVAWVVKDLIEAVEWRRLNNILFLLVKNAGLLVDPGVLAIDKAIRYCGPKFLNVNHAAPRTTQVVLLDPVRRENASFSTALTEAGKLRTIPGDDITGPVRRRSSFNQRFAIANQEEFQLDVTKIIGECKVLEEAVLTEGKHHSRDHWLNLIGLIAKNGDEEVGRKIALLISEEHPTHNPADTNEKFDYFRESGRGYTKCKTFEMSCPGLCKQCAHYGKYASPAGVQGALAREQREEQVATSDDGKILDGIYFNTEAGVKRKKQGDEEHHKLIWPGVNVGNLTLRHLDTNHRDEYLGFTVHTGSNWARDVELSTQQLGNSTKTAAALSEQGIAMPDRIHKLVQEAGTSWVQRLHANTQPQTKYAQLGWTANKLSIVHGTSVYHPDGTVEPIPFAGEDLKSFDTTGTVAEYQEIVNTIFCKERRPEAHAFLAASAGALLLELVGASGIALNFCSARSGHGKTTLSLLAASMYGQPRSLSVTLDDTENSVIKRMTILNNFPMFYDELRFDEDGPKKVRSILFRISSNVEKSRLTSQSTLQHRGRWRTIAMFSTNYTFFDLIRGDKQSVGDAVIARTMDFIMPPLPSGSQQNAANISLQTARLETIYAWTGHAWSRYVAMNAKAVMHTINVSFKNLMRVAHKSSDEVFARNHCIAGATMFAAAQHLRSAGILPLDRSLVLDAVHTAIDNARDARTISLQDHDPVVALRGFMREYEAHKLLVVRGGARGGRAVDLSGGPVRAPAMYEVDSIDKLIYIDIQAFERWLLKNNLAKRVIMGTLDNFRLPTLRPIGAGTMSAGAAIPLLVIKPEGDYSALYTV